MHISSVVGRIRLEIQGAREMRKPPAHRHPAKLMHSHENPNRVLGQISRRIAALQIGADSHDDLDVPASGEARGV
jgi:hypothetical protein